MKATDVDNEKLAKLKSKLICLQPKTKIKSIVQQLQHHLHKDIEFDTNPYIIVFKNGVYDLKKFKFMKSSKKSDYISNFKTTGYNFKCVENKMKFLKNEYLFKTFINECNRKVYLTYLATCLLGKSVKNFCLNNGVEITIKADSWNS